MKIYDRERIRVRWDIVQDVFNDYDLEISTYEDMMKEFYPELKGEDWKIAVAQLIVNVIDKEMKDERRKDTTDN